ncbi:MAG: lysylphosphatidylglycerol synthase transmembrane domain-containing protein [Actinomycetota bacterium]
MSEEAGISQDIDALPGKEARGGTTDAAPRHNGWRMAGNIFVLLWLGVGLYYLVPKFIGDQEMLEVVKSSNFLLIPVALLIETLSMAFICRLYFEVLRMGGGGISFPRMSLIYMSAYAFGHVVPGGNAGTFYLNYHEMRREGISRGLTIKTLGVSYIVYSAALVVLLAAGLLMSLSSGRLPAAYNIAAVSIAAGAAGFACLCVYVARRPGTVRRIAGRLLGAAHRLRMLRKVDEEEVEERVADLNGYLLAIFGNRDNLLRAGTCGLGFWLMDFLCLYVVFLAIGHPVNPGVLLVSYTIADIVGSLPLTPAGLGVFELTLGAALYLYGYSPEILATAILGYRFFSFWLCTAAGGGCYLALRLQRRRERRDASRGVA